MYHLRLCRGLSYSNGKVMANKRVPDVYVVDQATAAAAVDSGYFKLISGPDAPDFPPSGELLGHLDREQLESMTIPALKKLAGEMGVHIKGLKDKGLIIAAIIMDGTSAPAFDPEALAEMELDDLIACAEKNGISLVDVRATKEDVLEAICVANGGSYTMLDLMRE